MVNNSRVADLKALGLITITWAGAVAAGLWITRSSLPGDLRRRKPTTYPRVAEVQAGGVQWRALSRKTLSALSCQLILNLTPHNIHSTK